MKFSEILRRTGRTSYDGQGPLYDMADDLLREFRAREAERMDRHESMAVLRTAGPALKAIEKRLAAERERELFDSALPAATRFDLHAALSDALEQHPSDRGLKTAKAHAYQIWERDPHGTVAVGDLARFREHYRKTHPKSRVAGVIEDAIKRSGFGGLKVAKIAHIASTIEGATEEEIEANYITACKQNGLDSNKPEHVRARAYLRGLLKLAAEEANEDPDYSADGAVRRAAAGMAAEEDAILQKIAEEASLPLVQALDLFLENTGSLYPAKKQVLRRLHAAVQKGTYDPADGWDAWIGWVREGAQAMSAEMGVELSDDICAKVATDIETYYANELRSGGLDAMLKSGQLEPLDEPPLAPGEPELPPVEDEIPHEESTEVIEEVLSPNTGEPMVLELGVVEDAEIEEMQVFGQIEDFGETYTTIEDPTAPGEFIDVTLAPAVEEEALPGDEGVVELPAIDYDNIPLAARVKDAGVSKTYEVYAVDGGRAGGQPVDRVVATSMPRALGLIARKLAEVGGHGYEVRAYVDGFADQALIVMDRAAGSHLIVQAAAEGSVSKTADPTPPSPSARATQAGAAAPVQAGAGPLSADEVQARCAAMGLSAASIEDRLLADETVSRGDWSVKVADSGDAVFMKGATVVLRRSLMDLDEVIATFQARVAAVEGGAPKTASRRVATYDVTPLRVLGCFACGQLDEFALKTAAAIKCANCGTEMATEHVAMQFEKSAYAGAVLVADLPGGDEMQARRMLAAIREVDMYAEGTVRQGQLEVVLSPDVRAEQLAYLDQMLNSRFGVVAQALQNQGTSVQVSQQPNAVVPPTYQPPQPPPPTPIGQTPQTVVEQENKEKAASASASAGAFVVSYRDSGGVPRQQRVAATDLAEAASLFAGFFPQAQVLAIDEVSLEEMPPMDEGAEGAEGLPALPPVPAGPMQFASPSPGDISPEVSEAVAAAMLTYRNSGMDVATAIKTFQTQFKDLINRYGEEGSPGRQALGAEIVRLAQEAWTKPALLEQTAQVEFDEDVWGTMDDAGAQPEDGDIVLVPVSAMSHEYRVVEYGTGSEHGVFDNIEEAESAARQLAKEVAAEGNFVPSVFVQEERGGYVEARRAQTIPKMQPAVSGTPPDAGKVMGPDSSGDESSVMEPKVNTSVVPEGKKSPTDMGGGEEDLEPKSMEPSLGYDASGYVGPGWGVDLPDKKMPKGDDDKKLDSVSSKADAIGAR